MIKNVNELKQELLHMKEREKDGCMLLFTANQLEHKECSLPLLLFAKHFSKL